MIEAYTHGTWLVKPGEDADFVRAWTEFVTWASSFPGAGTFRLVRDVEEPTKYMSFAPWESFEAQKEWKDTPEFRDRIMRVRVHCDDFQPSVFELVTSVD